MKYLILLLLLISPAGFAQNVSFSILKNKTQIDKIGAITLFVEVINKSKSEVTILTPASDVRQKWRYYDCEVDCGEKPIWQDNGDYKRLPYVSSNLLVISPKGKAEIIIDGRHNTNSLSCNLKNFSVKLLYDATELINSLNGKNLSESEKEVIKKLTPIKIESKKTKIKL